ncbi:hypothetical protein C8R44DRAFT_890065 [Mycena epipterygia]|nr:hypothetical protein C8R44DRAFT_890065 [Mycena epipterygia]
MPKAPKTPSDRLLNPRPLRSTKKKISTPLFLKGDTEDSWVLSILPRVYYCCNYYIVDDGVLVNRPDEISEPTRKRTAVRGSKAKPTSSVFIDDEADDTDTGAAAVPAGVDRSASAVPDGDASDSPDKYEEEFINDGDPYDGVSDRSVDVTPPPPEQLLKVKLSTSTPLKRKRAIASSAVIDIPSSEEDLEAMADDDSMFKKPSGVKATALPPSLSTRSAVSSRSSPLVSSASASKASLRKKTRMHVENNEDVVGDSVPHSSGNADMAKFMGDWMSVFMKDNLPVMLASLASVPSANSSTDVISNSKPKPVLVRSPSPDWDLPFPEGALPSVPDSPSPVSRPKSTPVLKGKGKAVSTNRPSGRYDTDKRGSPVDSDVEMDVSKFKPSPSKKKPLTMAEFFGEPELPVVLASRPSNSKGLDRSTVFLEDIETYRSYFDADAPCGVFDIDLQDEVLRPGYLTCPPLPGGRQIIAAYDPNRNSGMEPPNVKGGRVKYGIWKKYIRDMYVDNSYGAMMFRDAAPNFINPSRVSPVRLSSKVSYGSTSTMRLHVDDRIATCVSALFCSESKLVSPQKIGGKSDRMRKWLSGIFHNQEWERFESLMCLVFGETVLRAQISTKHAVSFQTMISPDNLSSSRDANDMFNNSAPADMFAPVSTSSPSKVTASPSNYTASRSKTLLAYNDRVPVYDARNVVVDFDSDLVRLAEVLPPFVGEIPFGSFVVVGYTCSVYNAAISGDVLGISPILLVPPEIMLEIFFFALGSFTDNPRLYGSVQRLLRRVNKGWRAITDGSIVIWSCLYVSFSTSIPLLKAAIRRSKSNRVNIVLDLVDMPFVSAKKWTQDEIVYFVDVVFTALEIIWQRCESFVVDSASFAASRAVADHVRILRSSSLHRLRVKFHAPDARVSQRPPIFSNSGRPVSQPLSMLNALSELYICGTAPFWTPPHPFHNIRTLSLGGLNGRSALHWQELVDIIRTARLLVTLELMHLECIFPPPHVVYDPHLPPLVHLTHLEVGMDSTSAGMVVAALDAPSLFSIGVTATKDFQMRNFFYGQPLVLSRATLLALPGTLIEPWTLRTLLARAPCVQTLDLRSSDRSLANMLRQVAIEDLPDNYAHSEVAPRLVKILMGEEFVFGNDLVLVYTGVEIIDMGLSQTRFA